jgi:ADP-heptose:LPS heptosyltransferase
MQALPVRDGDGILLIRLGAVGDVVRTLPALARIRRLFPRSRIGWVVEPSAAPLLPGPPWLDRIFEFPRRALGPRRILVGPSAAVLALRRSLRAMREFSPAVALDFQGSLKSGILNLLSRAPHRVGFDRSGSREGSFLFSNLRVRPSSPRLNRIHKNLELLRPLGIGEGPLEFPFPDPSPSRKLEAFLQPLAGGALAAVHPGTSVLQRHKRWPTDRWARLVGGIAGIGLVPILTWGPGEESIVREVLAESGGRGLPAPPTTLPELRVLISRCAVFVGGDTGPMHLAWSQGVPVVALFGATDPRINGPLGEGHRILAPAWSGGRRPPRRGDPEAIGRILPEEVLDGVRSVLARSPGPSRVAELPS